MSHYYVNDASLKHETHILDVTVKNLSMRLHTDSGVFSKGGLDFGTKVLLENIHIDDHHKTIIDMGCGYGPISIYLAKKYPHVLISAYDVNIRAVELTQQNIIENNVKNATATPSFLFENVDKMVDVIVTNPPIRAGKQTVFNLYEGAYQHLNSQGLLYVVIQKKQGAPSTYEKLVSLFGQCEIIDKVKGYWVLLAKKS